MERFARAGGDAARRTWDTLLHVTAGLVILAAAALIAALAVFGVVAAATARLHRMLEERVAAEEARIAGEWAARPELAATLDAAAVVEHTLCELAALPGVDAAVLLVGEDGVRAATAVGLTPDEAERIALQTPPNSNLRALEVVYRYRLDDVDGVSPRPRAGVVVPLRTEDQTVGSLAVLSHSSTATFSEEAISALEAIARRAGPALLTAKRFAEARQLAELDSLTGLYNRRSFRESLEREVARARRYERRLALIVLDLDDFKRINDGIGHLAGDAVLSEVGRRILGIVRATDIACRFGGDEFSIILPESSRVEAELLADRLLLAIAGTPIERAGTLHASAGVAELLREDSGDDLFERADRALYGAKDARKGRSTVAS